MKSIFKSFLAVAALATVITVSSCTKTCDPGYEGSDCKTEWRTKFIGTYLFADVCPSGNYTGTATITVSASNVVNILLSNYAGIGAGSITGELTESNKITITSGSANGFTITLANGTMTNNIINWTYTINDGTATESCTSTWTKQ